MMMQKTILVRYALALLTLPFCATMARADDRIPLPAGQPMGQPSQAFRAKQIIGSAVSIDGNTAVGTVDDIVLDEGGNVDYLIVLNSERRLVTVPWDAAMFDVQRRTAVIHIAPAQFRQIPTYTVQQYPVFSTPNYRTQVYKYYGLTPGQQRRMIRKMDHNDRDHDRDRDRRGR